VIRAMALELPAFRLVVNTPAPHGSVGWTTDLTPSMSLGCGTPGGNITSDNISPMHLINIKRLAYERRPVDHDQAGTARTAKPQASPAPAIVTRPAPVTSSVIDRAEIARIVDRFLTAHGKMAAAPPANTGPSGSCVPPPKPEPKSAPVPSPAAAPTSSATSAPATPAKPKPVDFVCEDDVRRALTKDQKIHVGPRTIITPAARDLGESHEVFVRTT
jgi:acetaldehyde dehydrogenase (acetylating)